MSDGICEIQVDTTTGILTAGPVAVPCRIGKAGAVPDAEKREGDGATPLGRYRLMTLLVRPDRLQRPRTALPWRWLSQSDGWSDAVGDPAYNRSVRHPRFASAERLWREDGLYDLIVTTSHNTPPVAGRGSAIFFHCTVDGRDHTEGCVAIERDILWSLLPKLSAETWIVIGAS
ncbi:L,D-transpeptidase family protein [Pacificimonas sp. WHA3]|uniref:L,D-transpeptidase family protein n=1 Tax=Pacificimonas pallii TaxID=2827236 RepID=A0ABS6SAY3_9SPHN|nr:L,D-transpeptidase family protein [Pacificimonas pallii]MBV7255575.1 L,D-transpeptidase family protein [Pacificimonas pallii]